MVTIETDDVQGIILRGYGRLTAACFALLRVDDPSAARRWLKSLIDTNEITRAVRVETNTCLNIAFTHAGLVKLGLGGETLAGLSRAFQEGMSGRDERCRALGDYDESAPSNWDWGGPHGEEVHAVLLLYASDGETLAPFHSAHTARCEGGGWRALRTLETVALADRKEHFGFRDGISQPRIQNENPAPGQVGVLEPGQAANTVAAGEFLLGYRNEYGLYPPGPLVPRHLDSARILPADAAGSGGADFGRNGSYLVLRQLGQDVQGFWRFVRENAGGENFVELAAKMVGRWPNGAPLVKAPHAPMAGLEDDEDFAYKANDDAAGHRCPLGSHLRRANPRDASGSDPVLSVQSAKRHRIIRRGRPYGIPVDPSMDPERILAAPVSAADRGLHFLGFNADIARQFEFIHQNWLNNPKFAYLYQDKDPLLGDHPANGGQFCQQAGPVRRRVTGLPRFVRMRGGAYFFTPGLAALRYLASAPSSAGGP